MRFDLNKEVKLLDQRVNKAKRTFNTKVMSVYNYNKDRMNSILKTQATLEEEMVQLDTECIDLQTAMTTINNEGVK